uniref:HK3a n=1 Tax=Arundo donax TaxID=35708 RepID=A0A0A9DQU5_ARUDO
MCWNQWPECGQYCVGFQSHTDFLSVRFIWGHRYFNISNYMQKKEAVKQAASG